jgi:tetratricopeptide (TPR) repeat protein
MKIVNHHAFAGLLLLFLMLACSSGDPLEQAKEMQSVGNFSGSIDVLREVIAAGTDDPEVYFLYGVAHAESGNIDASVWPLRRASESPDWEAKALLRLGNGAFLHRSWDRSIKALNRLLELEPEHIRALVLRSRARIETRRDFEGALADAVRALEIDPDAEGAKVCQVVSLLGLDRADEAGELIASLELFSREVGPEQPNTPRFCGARASFALETKNTELADKIYTDCLEEFPSAPTLVKEALKFYSTQGEGERAIEILETAVAEAPDNRDYRIGLAVRLQAFNREGDAEEVLRKATESKSPASAAEAFLDLGGYLLDLEKFDEGIEAFDSAIALVTSPPADMMFRYADALIIAGRFDQAMEVADRAEIAAYRGLIRGRVHLEQAQASLALEELTEALQTWPENGVARYYAALAAEGVGDYARAIEEMRYSIRASAGRTNARARLARLYMAEGNLKIALEVLRHDVARQPGDLEMALLGVELSARLALKDEYLVELFKPLKSPDELRMAILAGIKGTRARSGPAAAVNQIHEIQQFDLADPVNAPVLELLANNLVDAGRVHDAAALLESYVEAHPEAAAFYAIRGLVIKSRDGVGSQQVLKDFNRALELDPVNIVALVGLGVEQHEAGKLDDAIASFDKAIEAAPENPEPLREAISMLVANGRAGETESMLERLLDLEPYDPAAALELVRLRIKQGSEPERSIGLARLAEHFGRGATRTEAAKLLVQLAASKL